MKQNIISPKLSIFFSCNGFTQIQINREWAVQNGNPLMLQWSNSITTLNSDLVTVGNTVVPGEGANVLLTRFDQAGAMLWQQDFNSAGTSNDFGIALTEDNNGNIYVVGTTDNNSLTDFDITILKYNSSGTLLWSKIWSSTYNLKDIATGITTDNTGNIYVCASSETPSSASDILTLKLDDSGNIIWENRYDKAALDDAPIGIEVAQNGKVLITGASASAINNWDYTVVILSDAGSYLNERRVTVSTSGLDQPLAFAKDNNENIYITGKTSTDGINYDMTTAKILPDYTIDWVKTVDFAGKEDVGSKIKVSDNGTIYVGGYITKSNDAKAMAIVKYDPQGNEMWRKIESATNPLKDAVLKALEKDLDGSIYYATEETLNSGLKRGVLSKVKASGEKRWRRKMNTSGNNTPTSIRKANDGTLYVTALKGATAQKYQTMRYSKYKQDTATVYNDDGKPIYKANELIVRFKAAALEPDFVNEPRIEYGGLSKVLTPQAYATLMDKFGRICKDCRLDVTAIKIFKHLTPSVTSTTSRLGTAVPVPDLWTALVLDFDGNVGIGDIHEFLKTVPGIVAYSEPNYFAETAGANDSLYSTEQKSLHPNSYPNTNHINIEEAWDIFPDAGYPFIRVGILDDGIQFKHEDFGYDGTSLSSSKIKGWDFESDSTLTSMTDSLTYFAHGTRCAGIIGALRNNDKGIAGIAGGNMLEGNTGVSLYGLRLFKSYQGHDIPFTPSFSPVQYVYDAIVMSSIDSNFDYAYGLNISSNSWRIDDSLHGTPYYTDTNLVLLREAVHFNNRMQVSFVACRGNEGYNSPSYPAVLDDDWVLSVGGSGENGDYYEGTGPNGWKPSYGHEMDVIAPSINDLVYTTSRDSMEYKKFNGTSAATPHVAGVVALLMSYLNEPVPSYKNLAPEDCERIIELSASDVGPVGYDSLNGWGRLNAGKALRLVEKPFRTVHHFGTNQYSQFTKESTLESSQQIVYLKEQTQNANGEWFPKGDYRVNTYRIDAVVEHDLPQEDSILYFWARPSMSTVFEPIKNDSLLPRERIIIDSSSFTQNSCAMTGYVYEMFDMSGNPLGWLPFDNTLSKAQFEYTVLTKEFYDVSVDNEQINSSGDWVNLYPNPSSDNQNLVLFLQNGSKLSVNLYDMQGRLIKTVYQGKQNGGETELNIDIASLSSGMYIYKIVAGDKVKSIQFIKQ